MAARALDRDEREAVLGDLAETEENELRQFLQVAGLALRRQVVAWRDWHPWLVLFALSLPLGLFLSFVSRFTAQQSSVYLWLYANNTHWDLLHDRGFWYELGNSTLLVSAIYLKLACWAWAAGLIIGSVTRKTWRTGYCSFLLMLFAGMICASMYLAQYLQWVLSGRFPQNLPPHEDPVSHVLFYRSVLPIIVQLFIVAVPAVSAMRRGAEEFSSMSRLAMVLLSTVVLGDMLLENSILWIKLCAVYSMKVGMRAPHPVLSLLSYWPLAYLLLGGRTMRQVSSRVGKYWRASSGDEDAR